MNPDMNQPVQGMMRQYTRVFFHGSFGRKAPIWLHLEGGHALKSLGQMPNMYCRSNSWFCCRRVLAWHSPPTIMTNKIWSMANIGHDACFSGNTLFRPYKCHNTLPAPFFPTHPKSIFEKHPETGPQVKLLTSSSHRHVSRRPFGRYPRGCRCSFPRTTTRIWWNSEDHLQPEEGEDCQFFHVNHGGQQSQVDQIGWHPSALCSKGQVGRRGLDSFDQG